jgi:poly(A) polymerase
MWSSWPWPDPVILTKSIPIISGQPTSDTNTLDNIEDFRNSLLPIVTPCYPVNNASPFVTKSTLAVLTKELQRADHILKSSDFARPTEMMDKFFKPLNLVKEYKHFIKVTVSCDSGKSHDIW